MSNHLTIKWKSYSFYELSLDLLYEILMLRQDVFIVEQNCPYLDTDGKDQKGWHICGFDQENELVAYTRILPKGISYEDYPSIGRVITSSKIRGLKKGRELMDVSIKKTIDLFGYLPIKISAQSHLQPYYQSVGFVTSSNEYDEDGIPHVAMILHHEN